MAASSLIGAGGTGSRAAVQIMTRSDLRGSEADAQKSGTVPFAAGKKRDSLA
jgi:hypothetical protein